MQKSVHHAQAHASAPSSDLAALMVKLGGGSGESAQSWQVHEHCGLPELHGLLMGMLLSQARTVEETRGAAATRR